MKGYLPLQLLNSLCRKSSQLLRHERQMVAGSLPHTSLTPACAPKLQTADLHTILPRPASGAAHSASVCAPKLQTAELHTILPRPASRAAHSAVHSAAPLSMPRAPFCHVLEPELHLLPPPHVNHNCLTSVRGAASWQAPGGPGGVSVRGAASWQAPGGPGGVSVRGAATWQAPGGPGGVSAASWRAASGPGGVSAASWRAASGPGGVSSASGNSSRRGLSGGSSSSMSAEEKLEAKLREALETDAVRVVDTSGGCGTMYQIAVASALFKGKGIVQQHQMVTGALKADVANWHGFVIHTFADKESLEKALGSY